jgi:hypothetical protein
MSWMDWAKLAVEAYGGYKASQSSNKGAQKGADAMTAEQRRQYDQTRQDSLPWLTGGAGAIGQMQAYNNGDFSKFYNTPDYRFAYDQGVQALDRSAAARGGLYSGGHSADLMKFGSGLAEQNYNTQYNRLAAMAGYGQTASQNLGQFGANAANYTGSARQSAYGTIGDNNAQLYAGLAGAANNAWGNYMGSRNTSYQSNPGYLQPIARESYKPDTRIYPYG